MGLMLGLPSIFFFKNPWACRLVCYNFFFWLESRTNIYIYFNWRVFLIFFFKLLYIIFFFRPRCSWEHLEPNVASPLIQCTNPFIPFRYKFQFVSDYSGVSNDFWLFRNLNFGLFWDILDCVGFFKTLMPKIQDLTHFIRISYFNFFLS